jgi:hypothetical protein
MVGLVNNELARMWGETVVVYFEELSQNLKISVTIVGFPAEIRTKHFTNAS